MKRKSIFGVAIAILSFFIILQIPNIVQAATTTQTTPTTTQVYQAAHPGLNLDDFLEAPSTYSTTESVNNTEEILKAKDTGYPTDIIHMTKSNDKPIDQVASVWGRSSKPGETGDQYDYDYFDLDKKQVISGWLYLGNTFGSSGDGIALVLQNDARGIQAISNYNWTAPNIFLQQIKHSKATRKETLGVWAAGSSPSMIFNSSDYAKGAIQNSLAVEFDSFRNETTSVLGSSLDNYFDAKLDTHNVLEAKGNHIAWNYPGEASTYQSYEGAMYYYYGMHHNNSIHNLVMSGDDTVQEAWHHFSFTYTPPTTKVENGGTSAQISYVFNDKDYDGTVRPYNQWDKREGISIDLSKFHLASGQSKIRWGFTSSTGSPNSKPADNSIILETIPRVADVTPTTSLYDLTQNREILDLDHTPDADSNVNSGDNLRFDYLLSYDDGLTATGDITTKIKLSKNVDFTSNDDSNLGKIIYTNKTTGKVTTVDIPNSSLNSDGTSLNLTLKSMDENDSNIDVQLFGTAQAPDSNVASSTTVDGAHTSYKSTYYTGDVMSPKFVINNEQLRINSSTDLSQTVKYGSSVTIQGNADYVRGTQFDGSDLTLHSKIDGQEQPTASVSTTKNNTFANFTAAYSGLAIGEHKNEVYLSDSGRRVSNTLTYDVTVSDNKNLKLSSTQTALNGFTDTNFNLSGSVSYDDSSQFSGSDITMHYVIDDGRELKETMTGTTNVTAYTIEHEIAAGTLAVGQHKIKVFATDGVRTSNSLTFTIAVTDKQLILTPDDDDITVQNNDPVTIGGTYKYSDDTNVTEKNVKVTYQITNQGETPQAEVSKTIAADGSISLTFDPIAKDKPATTDLDDYLSTHLTGLKEGENKITVTVDDLAGHVSNQTIYTINVPDEHPMISTIQNDMTLTSTDTIKFLSRLTYSDVDYVLAKGEAQPVFTVTDAAGTTKTFRMDLGSAAPETETTPIAINPEPTGADLGISTTGGPYKVQLYYTDPYGRKTNTITYNVTVLTSYTKLDVEPGYRFKNINYGQAFDGLVQRDGKWKINVSSFKSGWNLYGKQAGQLYQNDKSLMTADMMFFDDNRPGKSMRTSDVLIDSQEYSDSEETTDVTKDWDNDDGILLKVNDYDKAGTYSTTVEWTLVDSDE